MKNIRNFCIIAHIDHGKSTLADRLLEKTGTIEARDMRAQVLDSMDLERERGITIKMQAVRLTYKAKDGQSYILNLIDTPGHVDFSYEVARSLDACEGALLVVDASQGVEAQTLANGFLALNHNLTIIPVINKIDLPNADPDKTKHELQEAFGIDPNEAILCSAKEGTGTEAILEAVVKNIPPPKGEPKTKLAALIFDSYYDVYRGGVPYVRVVDGILRKGDEILVMSTGGRHEVTELGVFKPQQTPVEKLEAGEVGYIVAQLKDVSECRVGDTITSYQSPVTSPLPGFKQVKPMVYCGFYPAEGENFENLKNALEKLHLNDAALTYEPETSVALGFGFRCGFLGLLHLEIIQERLEREYGLTLVATSPNVVVKVNYFSGKSEIIENPAKLPDGSKIESLEEPFVKVTVLTPTEYMGGVMELSAEKRGEYKTMEYIDPTRVVLHYEMPLSEVITDFHDKLKSVSRGYASLDYELLGYRPSDLVKLNILLNEEMIDAFAFIVPRDKAYYFGRELVSKLKEVIPRQMFEVPIQAAIGSRVIARETVRAMRKNVLQKCYGGDVTRKRKLLEKQKAGKKRLRRVGNVDVPQEAFMAVLKMGK